MAALPEGKGQHLNKIISEKSVGDQGWGHISGTKREDIGQGRLSKRFSGGRRHCCQGVEVQPKGSSAMIPAVCLRKLCHFTSLRAVYVPLLLVLIPVCAAAEDTDVTSSKLQQLPMSMWDCSSHAQCEKYMYCTDNGICAHCSANVYGSRNTNLNNHCKEKYGDRLGYAELPGTTKPPECSLTDILGSTGMNYPYDWVVKHNCTITGEGLSCRPHSVVEVTCHKGTTRNSCDVCYGTGCNWSSTSNLCLPPITTTSISPTTTLMTRPPRIPVRVGDLLIPGQDMDTGTSNDKERRGEDLTSGDNLIIIILSFLVGFFVLTSAILLCATCHYKNRDKYHRSCYHHPLSSGTSGSGSDSVNTDSEKKSLCEVCRSPSAGSQPVHRLPVGLLQTYTSPLCQPSNAMQPHMPLLQYDIQPQIPSQTALEVISPNPSDLSTYWPQRAHATETTAGSKSTPDHKVPFNNDLTGQAGPNSQLEHLSIVQEREPASGESVPDRQNSNNTQPPVLQQMGPIRPKGSPPRSPDDEPLETPSFTQSSLNLPSCGEPSTNDSEILGGIGCGKMCEEEKCHLLADVPTCECPDTRRSAVLRGPEDRCPSPSDHTPIKEVVDAGADTFPSERRRNPEEHDESR